jgi:hypothetical protein
MKTISKLICKCKYQVRIVNLNKLSLSSFYYFSSITCFSSRVCVSSFTNRYYHNKSLMNNSNNILEEESIKDYDNLNNNYNIS